MSQWLFLKLYFFVGHLLLLCFLPKALYEMVRYGKYRKSLWQRLGIGFPRIVRQQKDQKVVWFHAVSLGETKAMAPFVKMWRKHMPQSLILISSVTETGHAEAQKLLPEADFCFYLPVDFSYVIDPIVKNVQPDWVILSEGDVWPQFLTSTKNYGAKISVINGKMSQRTFWYYAQFSWVAKYMLQTIDLWCVQSESYSKRLQALNVPKQKLVVTGNLKLDVEEPLLSAEERTQLRLQWGIAPEDLVLVLGSTHVKEDELLLQQVQKLWEEFPSLCVLLVPRHPERFQSLAQILTDRNFIFTAFSQLSTTSQRDPQKIPLILIDAMGLLKRCYQIADLAIVGGSYVPIGGHNIMEPLEYGVPAIFGPYMHKQLDFVQLVEDQNIKLQVAYELLPETLRYLLQNEEERARIGKKGAELFQMQQGATARTWTALHQIKSNDDN